MKFLEDPYQTLGAGFALAVGLIVVYLGMAGVGAGEADWFGLVIRWVHFLAGITWIGLLYFFNLINAGFLKSLDGPTKNIVIPEADACRAELVPPWRHGHRPRGDRALRLPLFKRWNGGACAGDRWFARYHHDGECARNYLAQSEESHCSGGCGCPGHARSAGDGSVGKNGLDRIPYQLLAVYSHVVLHGSGEPFEVDRRVSRITGIGHPMRVASPLFLGPIDAGYRNRMSASLWTDSR
jgi:hypothetical protein